MKPILIVLLTLTTFCAAAQTHLPVNTWGYGLSPWQLPSYNNGVKKWQLRPFTSVSAGYIFYNGGISYVSAPTGLALYRPLNNNWTAYGAATVSPTLFSINHLITNYHGAPYYSGYNLGLSTGIQGGLIYTNDAKTFSISGSVHIDRTTYPVYNASDRPRKTPAFRQ